MVLKDTSGCIRGLNLVNSVASKLLYTSEFNGEVCGSFFDALGVQ